MEPNNLFRAFARSVLRAGRAEAIRFQQRRWSYDQLSAAAQAAALRMHSSGVLPGDRVAFVGLNSDAYVIGFLATQLLGAVHVPLNFRLQPAEILYILEHCTPRILFSDDFCQAKAESAWNNCSTKPQLRPILELVQAADSQPRVDSGIHQDVSTPAQLAYTSGTESKPKGAVLSDNGLLFEYLSCISAGDYAASDVTVHAMPLYHCAQMHCFMLPGLLLGTRNIVLEGAEPERIMEVIEENAANAFFAPPTVWIGILNHPRFAAERLRSLVKGYYGASIMPVEVLQRTQQALPWLQLWNYYGQTEIGPLASVLRPEESSLRPASAGRPVLFVETRVVDDNMRAVPPGMVGEIIHRSPQLLLEYYRDPLRTAEAFQDGWFRSGDLGVVDEEGFLTVIDRKKDMIKTGGENVASREVEEVIYQHAAVAEVAVVGLPDEKWVERVVAFVVLKHGYEVTAADIIAQTEILAGFKRPKQVVFVGELPKNPSGKVMKRELRSKAAECDTPSPSNPPETGIVKQDMN